jgi:hypothetical protein
MLEKLIEVLENGVVQVRSVVTEGNTSSFTHRSIVPGADYSGEDAQVKAICAAAHTTAVISAYQASVA